MALNPSFVICTDRQNEVKEVDDLPSPREEEEQKPKKKGDIFEEIESEIQRHEEHKKKLGTYLKFLSTRDGGNIARTNRKRVKKGSDEEDSDSDEDEDSKIERIEMQRQNLSQQLRTMLETNNNNNPMARAAMQKRQMPPVILD